MIIIFAPNMIRMIRMITIRTRMIRIIRIRMIRNLIASEENLLICLKKVRIYIKSSQEQLIDHM